MAAKYFLFLDDQAREEGMEDFRYPPKDDDSWKIATSSSEAIDLVKEFGPPEFMSLDHDLGLVKAPQVFLSSEKNNMVVDTAMVFLKWLYENYPTYEPRWEVHSQNGEASKNMNAYLLSWKRSLTME